MLESHSKPPRSSSSTKLPLHLTETLILRVISKMKRALMVRTCPTYTSPRGRVCFDPCTKSDHMLHTVLSYANNQLITNKAAAASFSKLNPQDLVIFCGSPGSGKSTFYWKFLEPLKYERVNQDTLKSVSKIYPPSHSHSIHPLQQRKTSQKLNKNFPSSDKNA